jgi:hypothetical protein
VAKRGAPGSGADVGTRTRDAPLNAGWLVLILGFPAHPSSLRVKAWRRLRALGALPLKKSVYLLPFSADTQEQFQWLTQAVQTDGGEATLLKVDQIETMAPADVIRLFQEARNQDYRALAAQYQLLTRRLDRRERGRRVPLRQEPLARLAKEVERVRAIDFFDAPGHQDVVRLRDRIARRLAPPSAASRIPAAPVDLHTLKGHRWVTRPRPHIDRIGSAWLIRRFIDPEASLLFAPADAWPTDAIPFDVLGAEFGHQGDDCTFETIIKRCGLRDRRLGLVAEIVHAVDLRDDKFRREEAPGIDRVLRGLLATLPDDQAVLAHGFALFDGLYATARGPS